MSDLAGTIDHLDQHVVVIDGKKYVPLHVAIMLKGSLDQACEVNQRLVSERAKLLTDRNKQITHLTLPAKEATK